MLRAGHNCPPPPEPVPENNHRGHLSLVRVRVMRLVFRVTVVTVTIKIISTRMRVRDIGNESVPIQLAQCWFSGLAISNAKK